MQPPSGLGVLTHGSGLFLRIGTNSFKGPIRAYSGYFAKKSGERFGFYGFLPIFAV